MTRTTNATTRSKWISAPPICRLKPSSHKIKRTTRIVQSIAISLYTREVNLIPFAREPLRANREESRNRIKTAASAESQTAPARFNKYLLLIVSVVVLLLFLYDRLDLGSVNFRNERLSYDWNRHLARQ